MSVWMVGMIFGVLLGIFINLTYNGLINRRNRMDQSFSSVDVLLKKRHDLIPNLVAAVQQYMAHERELLTRLTELRTQASAPGLDPAQQAAVEGQLGAALGRLMAVAENYPDLKANTNFLQFQAALNEIEEQISAARRAYNAAVTDYNNGVQMFPSSLIASMMKLTTRPWFELPEPERQNVDVGALFKR